MSVTVFPQARHIVHGHSRSVGGILFSARIMRFMLRIMCIYNVGFLDMSDAVIWLMEYLQDEAKDREEDGRCATEGIRTDMQ